MTPSGQKKGKFGRLYYSFNPSAMGGPPTLVLDTIVIPTPKTKNNG